MDLREMLGAKAHHTYLVLYRIKKAGGIGSADERRERLTSELALLNGERRGRFFQEAGHVSTSAWTVRVDADVTPDELVQGLKIRAKLSAGIDYLWAIQIAEPLNEKHLTRDQMPVAGAKMGAKKTAAESLLNKIRDKS